MAKSKHSRALFEVLTESEESKGSAKLRVPKWWQGGGARSAGPSGPAAVTPPATPAESPEPAKPAPAPRAEAPPPREARPEPARPPLADAPDSGSGPVIRVQSGRVHLSLNLTGAIVAAGGLLLMLLTAYQVGHNVGASSQPAAPRTAAAEDAPAGEFEALLHEPPNPDVLTVVPPGGARPAQPPGAAPTSTGTTAASANPPARLKPEPTSDQPVQRTPGLNYAVLQIFKNEDQAAAEFARDWLAAKGVPTTLEHHGRQSWKLLSVQDFGSSDARQSSAYQRFRANVQVLGKALAAELGRNGLSVYDLRDPYLQRYQQ